MSASLALAVLAPLLGGALCLCCGRSWERWVGGATAAATLASAAALAWLVGTRGTLRHQVGGWGASLGIDLRADGIAALMLLAIGVVGALITTRSVAAWSTSGPALHSLSTWFFAWASLDALVLSADIFNLYVTLELATLAAVGLISTAGRPEAGRAALRYLLLTLPGSLVYLLGVALTYATYGTLDLTLLGARFLPDVATMTALALMSAGLCLKAALFPLHAWLPPAYVSSLPTVSALLAGLIGKGPFYVLLRIWMEAVPLDLVPRTGLLLGVLGAAGLLWGSVQALRQKRLKPLVAYSSVAQIGYLFLVFALGTPGAWVGGVYLAVSHAAAKASMFLAAGTIEHAIGRDDLDGLRGMAHHLPVTFFALALAGVNLMGMPPSGGFIAKWLLVRAAFERGQWWLAAVVLVGGLLAAGYVFKVLRIAFLPARDVGQPRAPLPSAELVPLALALIALLLGLAPAVPLQLLQVGLGR